MTLLEIIVVLVITASLASLVVLRFNNHNGDHLRLDTERFAALFQQHCQDSMLLSQIRGLSLTERGYQFWYRADNQWHDAAHGKKLYRPREWAGDWDLELIINGLPESINSGLNSSAQKPQLICMADGLLPLFSLRISSQQRNISGLELISNNGKYISLDSIL